MNSCSGSEEAQLATFSRKLEDRGNSEFETLYILTLGETSDEEDILRHLKSRSAEIDDGITEIHAVENTGLLADPDVQPSEAKAIQHTESLADVEIRPVPNFDIVEERIVEEYFPEQSEILVENQRHFETGSGEARIIRIKLSDDNIRPFDDARGEQ